MTTAANTNFSDGEILCRVDNNYYHSFFVFYLCVTGILIVCNLLLLVAIATNWNILRRNIVHVYLISQLLSSVALCVLSAYEIYYSYAEVESKIVKGGIEQRYNKSIATHQRVMRAWTYRKALSPTMLVIMEYNIAALIYAVGDNTYFVGRFANSAATHKASASNKDMTRRMLCIKLVKGRKFKAACLIFAAWAIPFIVSIPAAFDWNCMDQCKCLPAFRQHVTCFSDASKVCSRAWLPNAGSFTIVMSLMYFGAILFMFAMLTSVIRKFYKISKPRTEGTEVQMPDPSVSVTSDHKDIRHSSIPTIDVEIELPSPTAETNSCVEEPCCSPNSSDKFAGEELNEEKQLDRDEITRDLSVSRKIRRPPLHNTIKLLIALTVSFFASVTPMVLVTFIDVLVHPRDILHAYVFNITLGITYVHSAALPFILLVYMSGLRKSFVKFLLKCPCLSTTEIKKVRAKSAVKRKSVNPGNRTFQIPEENVIGEGKSETILQDGPETDLKAV